MKRLVVMVVAAGAAMMASAMPTEAELQKAQEMVNDVTSADVAALKAKSKTPAEVAAKHMELAGQAGSEAEKYLLLQAAFKLYAKAGDYDAAANVIEKLQAEITDYDPEVTVELCGAEFIRKMRENAPRLYALKENARRIVFYRKQLPIREAAVRKNPRDQQAQRKLAECHAELGDWPKALDVFVKAGGEFKKMSEGETSGKIPAQELGDFWWDYETKSDTQVYKLHAAELYRKTLADDSFKGLARTRAEQRVKEVAVDLPLKRIGGGADASAKNGACEFKGVLPTTQHVLLWKNVSLKEISQLQASLCGGFIPNDRVQSCYMKENGTRKTFQFQAIADGHIKCVGVELIQRDGDVHGRISYARYTKYASKDVDFDLNHGGKMDIAKTETDVGYAVKDLAIIDGETPSSRPAPLTFDLAKDVKLEMIGCPAGTFKMSNAPGGPSGDGTHEVKLTRAYWIASSCVTRAMYKVFEADYDKDEKKEGEKKPDDQVTGYARAEAFASWLNKRFQSKLPRGYVFRLPSEAEWEYAMNTGVVARHWGFEGTLDTVRAVSGKANAWKFDVSVMDYAAKESDPVRVYSQNPAWVCRQNAEKRFLLRMGGQGCFRMAVGPDLIAEKKAKGK